ncbi:MAG: NUDIX domain-containing protein [Nanoarchaeota archaeon]|mgnify:FL=1
MKLIKKSALAVIKDNKLLVVRAKGSSYVLMPGGKPREGESAVAALKREIMEELGCGIDESFTVHLGTFEDVAAGGDARVSIDLFTGRLSGTPRASSEIEELIWIAPAEINHPQISPIIRNKILPFLVGKRMLS